MAAQHIRVVNLSNGSGQAKQTMYARDRTYEDTPQVDECEKADKEVLVDWNDVACHVIWRRLKVPVDRVESV